MKYTKRISLILVLSLLILALAGCGKMTTEKLALKMVEATGGKMMTQATTTMDLELDMTLGQGGMNMDLGMDINYDMDMKMQADPYLMYGEISMDMAMEIMGQTMEETLNTKTYMELVDGKAISYAYDESTDTWQSSEVDMEETMESVTKGMDYSFLKDMIPEIIMDEEKQILNGTEVYVLRMTITGEQMQKAMGGAVDMESMLGQAGLEGELDFSALEVPAVIYVDAKTYLPVKMEMEIVGMGEMMKSMMGPMLGAAEGVELDLDIPVCKVVYENIGFDPVEIPEIPAEARN